LAANAFVVPLDLLEFEDAEADSVAVAVLLPLACCVLLLLAAKLSVELAVFDLSSVNDEVWLADWFSEALTLEVELSFFVTFDDLFTVSWLFCPRS
jgi:hypothetical protein